MNALVVDNTCDVTTVVAWIVNHILFNHILGLAGVGRAAHAVGHAAARQWRRLRGERDDATTESLLPVPPVGSLFVISNLQLREMVTAGAASGLAVCQAENGHTFANTSCGGKDTKRCAR